MWSGNFRAAVNSLRSTKWRSLLTMMGVIIGITLVVTTVSLAEGIKHEVVGQVNRLGSDVLAIRSGQLVTRGQNGQIASINFLALFDSSTLTTKDINVLKTVKSVDEVTPVAFVTSSVSNGPVRLNNVYVMGTEPTLPKLLHEKVAYGDFFQSDGDQRFAVIGSNIAHKLYGELNPTGRSITINGQPYIIRGVLAPSTGGLLSIGQADFNSAVFLTMQQAQSINKDINLVQILVRGKDDNTGKTIADVKKALLSSHQGREDFSILKQDELVTVVNSLVNKLTGFISALAAISLLVGGIGIMSIMLASVSERSREIGIRKAIGATNRQILNQFMVEGLVITVTGGLIGVVVSLIVFGLLQLYTDLDPVITAPILISAVLVAIFVGIVFSIAPALKAARKDPINALRGD
ncbi:MAG TPA: ABC transporter permease [Candidatus Saccharimonadales bacterium]|nr:ABC transporter permease [Candidatus Saccharimonadales bacterium]